MQWQEKLPPPLFYSRSLLWFGVGVSSSYNRLEGTQGLSLYNNGVLPGKYDPEKYQKATVQTQTAFFYGTNNITPSGWGGPGLTIHPELGYTYKVPKSSLTVGLFLNGGIAKSGQNAQVPVYLIDTDTTDDPGDPAATYLISGIQDIYRVSK